MARIIYPKHKFLVEVPARIASAGFQKCSEIKRTTAKITYHEGGAVIPIKDAGRIEWADVTCTRGTSNSIEMHTWCNRVNDASIAVGFESDSFGRGELAPLYKEDVGVVQLDRDNSRPREWHLSDAFPVDYVAGDWDNTVDEVVVESLVLTFDNAAPVQ